MKTKVLIILAVALIPVFFIVALAQKTQNQDAKIKKTPFIYNAKDFGKVESISKKKVNSQHQTVIDKFPIDAPAHTCFNLEAKRPLPALEKGGRYFFPTYSFICFVPTADSAEKNFAEAYPNFSNAVIKLRKLLDQKPLNFEQFDDLFDFPYNNAGWTFKSKIQYLDYRNIAGVFFLTQYSNGILPSPANNEELTVNFQGLTKDGKFYVAARFAAVHPSLPKGIDFVDESIQEKGLTLSNEEMRKYERKYLMEEGEKVEKLSEDKFQPSLTNLKKLISTISLD